MTNTAKYAPLTDGVGGNNWGRNRKLFKELDALAPGDSWEVPVDERTKTAMYRAKGYYEEVNDRKLCLHATSRGWMFVRIE